MLGVPGLAIVSIWVVGGLIGFADPEVIDLTGAVVVSAEQAPPPEINAVKMLIEEVEARSRIRWERSSQWPDKGRAVIVVATEAGRAALVGNHTPPTLAPPSKPESYRIAATREQDHPVLWVLGHDSRGVLFGVGRLLRELRLHRDKVELPGRFAESSAPKFATRGHQLGYRPKTNSYDAWSAPMWEQYIRDLAVFGCNAIELIPPRSDDDGDSPHFPLPQLAMMVEMSRLADAHGMDVWLWYPALDEDYTNPKTMQFALDEWARIFRALPRIDHVFVPGGDPGATPPQPLFQLLERQTANLKRSHPNARMWFSPQGFDQKGTEEIMKLVQREPDWLGGLVFGPQVRMNLPELRAATPDRYPIRFYPDITHTRSCQYPVPNWDRAFALTEAREVINPRPLDQAAIFRKYAALTNGFVTYSEGCNDDVNKCVWSALGWDPDADVTEVLRQFARYYVDTSLADPLAQGLLALERNWRGLAIANDSIETTLSQFQAMERAASPRIRRNWRFQQALYRAYYDAFVHRRVIHESGLESQSIDELRAASSLGSLASMAGAESILDRAVTRPVAPELRTRLRELAEALFQSIRMQLSVEKYGAIEASRGASQDTLEMPLNNRLWLKERFAQISKLPDEVQRLKELDLLINQSNPGPGGFHDDLGSLARSPHLVKGPDFEDDPSGRSGVLMHFDNAGGGPISYRDHALTLYEQPLKLHYDGLDPEARYRARVVCGTPVRVTGNGGREIRSSIEQAYTPVEFPIPRELTVGGKLDLEFHGQPGRGGNGRTCAVAEVWLIRDGS